MQEYESLERRFREAATVRSIAAMLGWDQETFLPGKGAVWRGWRGGSIVWLPARRSGWRWRFVLGNFRKRDGRRPTCGGGRGISGWRRGFRWSMWSGWRG